MSKKTIAIVGTGFDTLCTATKRALANSDAYDIVTLIDEDIPQREPLPILEMKIHNYDLGHTECFERDYEKHNVVYQPKRSKRKGYQKKKR